jgi:hypothetical protein
MDMQKWVNEQITNKRKERMSKSDQLTLGKLIEKIEHFAKRDKDRPKEEMALVKYDFEYLFPTDIDSWRGSYAELALNFKTYGDGGGSKPLTTVEFYKLLYEANGETFTGYKGGDYKMGNDTPIWVANYGHSGDTAVIDVVDNKYEIILITGYRPY